MGWSFVDAAAAVNVALVLGAFVALLEGFGALAAFAVASDPFVTLGGFVGLLVVSCSFLVSFVACDVLLSFFVPPVVFRSLVAAGAFLQWPVSSGASLVEWGLVGVFLVLVAFLARVPRPLLSAGFPVGDGGFCSTHSIAGCADPAGKRNAEMFCQLFESPKR